MPTMEFSRMTSRSSSTVCSRCCDWLSASTIACSAAMRACACSLKRRATLIRAASANESSTISSAEPISSELLVSALDGSTPVLCRKSSTTPASSSAHAAR